MPTGVLGTACKRDPEAFTYLPCGLALTPANTIFMHAACAAAEGTHVLGVMYDDEGRVSHFHMWDWASSACMPSCTGIQR